MSERYWRLTLGVLICLILSLDMITPMLVLIGVVYFEAITNIRLTKVISRWRFGKDYKDVMQKGLRVVKARQRFSFEAEQMVRFATATVLLLTFYLYPVWFIPWLVGIMLTSAGLTGICPMLVIFQWAGFKSTYR